MKRSRSIACIMLTTVFLAGASYCSSVWSREEINQKINALLNAPLEDLLTTDTELKLKVGTRGKKREATYALAPIDVITADQMEKTGFQQLGKVLQRFVPSLNFPQPSITDGTDHVTPFTLRGMGADQVLVLINGKRLHSSALLHLNGTIGRGTSSVDLNAIPVKAIARVEILRDGAAAQYGSDAIAGIINIVLKTESNSQTSATYGQRSYGDGELKQIDYYHSFPLDMDGFFNITMAFRDKGKTNRAGPDLRQQYFDGDSRNFTANHDTHWFGEADSRDVSLVTNSEFAISDDYFLYQFSHFNYRESEAAGFYRRPLDNRNVRLIYPDGFLPLISPKIQDASFTLGGKGETVSGLKWDISNTFGKNQFDFYVNNSINASMGTNSPTSFYDGGLIFNQNIINLDFFKLIHTQLTSPLKLAFGAEWKYEQFKIKEGDSASYHHGGFSVLDGPNAGQIATAGAQVFPGFKPENVTNVTRDSYAFYIDVENEIRSKINAGAAVRYEYFTDFGSTLNGKLAFTYQPTSAFSILGSTSTGFKSPSLMQSHYTSTATVFLANTASEVGTFSVDHPLSKALGATPLKPEVSQHINVGFRYQPIEQMLFSADYFQTNIKDRIIFSNNINQDASIFSQQIISTLQSFGVAGARFFSNVVDTQSNGGNVSAQAMLELRRWGKLKMNSTYHFNQTRITSNIRVPVILGSHSENIIFSRNERKRLEYGQPNNNFMLSLEFIKDPFSLLTRLMRFGSFEIVRVSNDPLQDQAISAEWVTDMELAYRMDGNVTVAMGGHNIFDTLPDELNNVSGNNLSGKDKILRYPQFSPFGFSGALYYITYIPRTR